MGRRPTGKEKQKISQQVYKVLQDATNKKTGKFDRNLVPKSIENYDTIAELGDRFQRIADKNA